MLVPYAIALALIVWPPADTASRATGIVFRLARFASERADVSCGTASTLFEFAANIALIPPRSRDEFTDGGFSRHASG